MALLKLGGVMGQKYKIVTEDSDAELADLTVSCTPSKKSSIRRSQSFCQLDSSCKLPISRGVSSPNLATRASPEGSPQPSSGARSEFRKRVDHMTAQVEATA
jgi:hypothetical protein